MNDNQNPSSDQPLVTHADRDTIELLALCAKEVDLTTEERGRVDEFLKRNRAAAEADKPALPEGWVLRKGGAVHWHQGGLLYNNPDDLVMNWAARDVEQLHRNGALTPLATAASLAPEGWHVDEDGEGFLAVLDQGGRIILRDATPTAEAFDVLAALVTAAEAERGASR